LVANSLGEKGEKMSAVGATKRYVPDVYKRPILSKTIAGRVLSSYKWQGLKSSPLRTNRPVMTNAV